MVGSIGNLFTSFANLNETYLTPSIHKNVLLNPVVFSSTNSTPLLISKSFIISSGNLYTCRCDHRTGVVTNIYNGASCSVCGQKLNKVLKFVAGSENATTVTPPPNDNSMVLQGYVKEMVPYLVSDDLSVTPISTMSIISMTKMRNASKLEERKVNIGTKEALELLKMSFQSTTVLTDVFLGRKLDKVVSSKAKDVLSSQSQFHPHSPAITMPPKDQTSRKRTRSPSPPRTRSQIVPSRDGGNQASSSSLQQSCRSAIPVTSTSLPTPTQVHYFKTYLRKRGLTLERGIDFPSVDFSFRIEVARRYWHTLATHPTKQINVTMVHEFFALIHDVTPQPTSVTVRGVNVDFSSSTIMAHFKIQDFPIEEHFETVWKLSDPKLRDAKVIKAHDFLDKNAPRANNRFPYDSISLESKLWKYFVNFRFHPSSDLHHVTEDEALILLAILTNVPVHVGHLIHKTIIKYANQFTDWNIPFPNTISALCNSAGVPRLASDQVAMANSAIIGARLLAFTPSAPKPRTIMEGVIDPLSAEIAALHADVDAGFERHREMAEDLRDCIYDLQHVVVNIARGAVFDPDDNPRMSTDAYAYDPWDFPVAPDVPPPTASSSGTTRADVDPPRDNPMASSSLHDSSVLLAAEILMKDLHVEGVTSNYSG